MNDTPQTIVIENKPHINWPAILLSVAAIILAILWIRGCKQSGKSQGDYSIAMKQVARLKWDSIQKDKELADLKRDSAGTNELARDLQEDQDKQEQVITDLEIKNTHLAKEVKRLKGSPDTVTLLNNCEDLADHYLAEVDENKRFRAISDSVKNVLQLKIIQRDAIAKHWEGRYIDCMKGVDTIAHALPSLKPRGAILIGGNGIYSPFVIGGGPSIAYMDKGKRVYQGNLALTNHGNVYSASVMLPLNWKRR